jgi:hypothetical protein
MNKFKKFDQFINEKKVRVKDKTEDFKLKLKAEEGREKELMNDLISHIEKEGLSGLGGLADLFSKDVKIKTENGKASLEILGKPDITDGFKDNVIQYLTNKRDGKTNVYTTAEKQNKIEQLKSLKTNYTIVATFDQLKETYPNVWTQLVDGKFVIITPSVNEMRWQDVSDVYIPAINFCKSFFHLLYNKSDDDYKNDEDRLGQWGETLSDDLEKFQNEFTIKDERDKIASKTWTEFSKIIDKDEKLDLEVDGKGFLIEPYVDEETEKKAEELMNKDLDPTPSSEELATAIKEKASPKDKTGHKALAKSVADYIAEEHNENFTDETAIKDKVVNAISTIKETDPMGYSSEFVNNVLYYYEKSGKSTNGFVKDIISDFDTTAEKITKGLNAAIKKEMAKFNQDKPTIIKKFIYSDKIHEMNKQDLTNIQTEFTKIKEEIDELVNDLVDVEDIPNLEERKKKDIEIRTQVNAKLQALQSFHQKDQELRQIDAKSKQELKQEVESSKDGLSTATWMGLSGIAGWALANFGAKWLLRATVVGFVLVLIWDLWDLITSWSDDTDLALEIFLPFAVTGSKKFLGQLKAAGVDTSEFENLFTSVKAKKQLTEQKTAEYQKAYAKKVMKSDSSEGTGVEEVQEKKTTYFSKFDNFEKR